MGTESILTTIKKMLGIEEDYEVFDTDIKVHINTVFSILRQIGIGPEDGYRISGKDNTWNEFLEDELYLNDVIDYVYYRVRVMFDPPTSGSLMEASENLYREIECRLSYIAESNLYKREGV